MSVLYDKFHKETSIQRKLIDENNFTYRLLIPEINKYLKTPKKILDIGCGAGTLSLYYAKKGNNVTGIDISKNAVGSANESAKILRLNNVRFSQVNFPKSLPVGKYDFIILTEVLEHLKDDELALRKINSLLNKGGILFISTPSQNAPLYKLGLLSGFDKEVGHLRRYSIDELVKKCEKNGLTVVKTKKTEGIIRNFLFTNPYAGKVVRFIKFQISDMVTVVDNMTVPIFGESNIFVVAKKI